MASAAVLIAVDTHVTWLDALIPVFVFASCWLLVDEVVVRVNHAFKRHGQEERRRLTDGGQS